MDAPCAESVRVAVRVRPLSAEQSAYGAECCVDVLSKDCLSIKQPRKEAGSGTLIALIVCCASLLTLTGNTHKTPHHA